MAKIELPRDELQNLYKTQSTSQIAKQYGVCAEVVRRRIHEYGITVKPKGARRVFDPPASELNQLYQTMSMAQIAEHYSVGETVVFKRLKEHGIEVEGFINHRLKTGKTFSPEHRQALSKVKTGKWAGAKNPNWNNGVRAANLQARSTGEYKQWRYAALARSSFACECCGIAQGTLCNCCGHRISLHVHHIKSFAQFPEVRFDPKNSEVLCPKCHHAKHN